MIKNLKQIGYAAILTALMAGQAVAQTAEGALDTVKKSVSIVLDDLKANKASYQKDPAALNRMIDEKMVPYFDIEIMAKYVLGKNWKSATKQQQADFLSEFKQMIMRTYSASLLDYTDAEVTYGEPDEIKKKRTKVKATVVNNAGKRFPLELSMRYKNNKWLGYDVSLDGLSVVTSYRSSVGEEVAQKGIQAVIDEMKVLNAKGQVKK